MKEVEIKILNIDPARMRRLLKERKAKLVKKVLQRNTHYQSQLTKQNHVTVRLREEGKSGVLAVKANKRIINNHKVQDEYETEIDAAVARKMLELLGFHVRRITEMKREYYTLKGCSVEICELPGIPAYIEIEGTRPAIKAVATLLGYGVKDYEPRTAFEIYKIDKNLTF